MVWIYSRVIPRFVGDRERVERSRTVARKLPFPDGVWRVFSFTEYEWVLFDKMAGHDPANIINFTGDVLALALEEAGGSGKPISASIYDVMGEMVDLLGELEVFGRGAIVANQA